MMFGKVLVMLFFESTEFGDKGVKHLTDTTHFGRDSGECEVFLEFLRDDVKWLHIMCFGCVWNVAWASSVAAHEGGSSTAGLTANCGRFGGIFGIGTIVLGNHD